MTDIKAIITGATGMVGEGVLHVCLQDPRISSVLIINRKPLGLQHPKLKEVIHADFFDLSAIEGDLIGYNACFFCLGVSSVGMKEDAYYRLTHTLTLHVATTLARLNTDMTFCYISGAGTDSTEKGRSMWARVKGKTENDVMQLPFRRAFAVRPGFIKPIPGLLHAHSFYKYINWLFPIGRVLYPAGFCTLQELGLAMIRLAEDGYRQSVITGKDIIELGKT
jgi:uncharacterized protein YbjT (DUF2867 family)